MKFLNEKGKIVEGTPLTNEQADQRERLIAYFHQTACDNGYHGPYSDKKCESLANAFVLGDIAKAADGQIPPALEVEEAQ